MVFLNKRGKAFIGKTHVNNEHSVASDIICGNFRFEFSRMYAVGHNASGSYFERAGKKLMSNNA